MARKTVRVDRVREMTNDYLAHADSTVDGREAVANILESLLFETGQYAGFRYLDTAEIEGNGTRRHYFA